MGAVKCVLLTWTSTCMKMGGFAYVCFVVCSLSIDPTGTVFNLSAKFYTSDTSQPPTLLICASLPILISFVACTLVTDNYSCLESTINTFFKIHTVYPCIIFHSKLYHPVWVFFVSLFMFFYSDTVCLMCIPSLLCFYNHQY